MGVVALTVAFAAPATAGTTPSGATNPRGFSDPSNPSDGSSTSSSTSTTTTTKPRKKPSSTTTTTTTPPPTAAVTPGADPAANAGPPELAKTGVVLPDDSLAAATAELALERAGVDQIAKHRDDLDLSIQTHDQKLKKVHELRKREEAERLDRALATYRGQSSGWRLGAITSRGLDEERALYLVGAADAATRQKIEGFDHAVTRLDQQLAAERVERAKVGTQLDTAIARVNRLLDKLADSAGTISIINGVPTYVPTGPSPIALTADAADKELSRLMLTHELRATDQKWLSARHDLATQIATSKPGVDAAATAGALEQSWDTTPADVVHAMLFALRQVGKPYIYATDGPDTFDCSGLTKAAYAQIQLGLPHFSGAQLHLGLPVAPDALRPGDLLTYGPDGSEHVTMFIGANLDVEAKGRAYGVVIAGIRTDPAKGFAGATRIVP
ncbi:MAG TPA: NlpC/P60 family protein [Acidimicrobiia bacterium]